MTLMSLPIVKKLIDVFIDRFEDDQDSHQNIFCVEPTQDFNNRFSLLMASCLKDLKDQVSTKVRSMNPFKTDVKIKQDEVLGEAELIDPQYIQVILSPEGCGQGNQPTRKIQSDNKSQKGNNSSETSKSYIQEENDSPENADVLDYL